MNVAPSSPPDSALPVAYPVDNSIHYLSNNTVTVNYNSGSDRNCKVVAACVVLGTALGTAVGLINVAASPNDADATTTPIGIMLGALGGVALGSAYIGMQALRTCYQTHGAQVHNDTLPTVNATIGHATNAEHDQMAIAAALWN